MGKTYRRNRTPKWAEEEETYHRDKDTWREPAKKWIKEKTRTQRRAKEREQLAHLSDDFVNYEKLYKGNNRFY